VKGTSYRPGLTFEDAELAAVRQPTLHVFGTDDPIGTADLWKRVADTLPHGELWLVAGAGHVPWFDDPRGVAGKVRAFLAD
jgi:pimeloyl-ACP methyl ester carboxylesterase